MKSIDFVLRVTGSNERALSQELPLSEFHFEEKDPWCRAWIWRGQAEKQADMEYVVFALWGAMALA